MPLSNAQYNEIMKVYDERQLKGQHIAATRLKDAYERSPRLKTIDESIASYSVKQAQKLLSGDKTALTQLKKQIKQFQLEREEIFGEMGYNEDFFKPVYTCPDCKDTGYIDGRKCHCFQQAIIDTVYSQSNIKNILERENFNNFSYEYYSDTDISPITGLSALQTAKNAVSTCWHFIEDFDNKPKNLFIYGDVGVGKTYLTNCVAKEILDRGNSVIYFTSFQLFDILSKGIFQKDTDALATHQNIFDCDLLIIDDLGTELVNSFTVSQLFLCINERILRQRSTIISANLDLNQMLDTYSERIVSRIASNYSIIKLFGDDIRFKKRSVCTN